MKKFNNHIELYNYAQKQKRKMKIKNKIKKLVKNILILTFLIVSTLLIAGIDNPKDYNTDTTTIQQAQQQAQVNINSKIK